MVQRLLSILLFLPLVIGCSDSDEPLRGWKESDVEIVEPGTTGAPATQVVAPGEAPLTAPMTDTAIDTSTDLDMIDDQYLAIETGTGNEHRSLADGLEPADPVAGSQYPARATPTTTRRPATSTTAPEPATSTTSRSTTPMTDTTSTTTSRERDRPGDQREGTQPERSERPQPSEEQNENDDDAAEQRPKQDDTESDPPPVIDETPPTPGDEHSGDGSEELDR